MYKLYIDAGTSWSKIFEIFENTSTIDAETNTLLLNNAVEKSNYSGKINSYIIPSDKISGLNIKFNRATGHMIKDKMTDSANYINEAIALAYGGMRVIKKPLNNTIIDVGSRDVKWVSFKDDKYNELDWNGTCGSATGATVEMLCNFYNIDVKTLNSIDEKIPVTCGVFGMEKIMDIIAKGGTAEDAIAKYIHGLAYNIWKFAKKPEKIYLSGGFCQNKCFVESLKYYSEVELIGRFVLLEGLF